MQELGAELMRSRSTLKYYVPLTLRCATSSPSRPPTPAVRRFPWPESSVCGSLGETCQPNSSLWEYLQTSGSLSPALFWKASSLRWKRDGDFARYTPPFSSHGHVGQFIIKITKSKLMDLTSSCIMGCGVAFSIHSDNLLVIFFSHYRVFPDTSTYLLNHKIKCNNESIFFLHRWHQHVHIWMNACHQIPMQLIRRLKYAALIQLLGLMSTMSPSNSNSEYIGGDLWGAERRYFWTFYPRSPLRRLQRSGLSALKCFRLGCPELQSCFQPDLFGKGSSARALFWE